MITPEQKNVFDELVQVLDESAMLRHVMLIGSWAEYLYQHENVLTDYDAFIRTRDIDFLIMNLRKPPERTDFLERMQSAGFFLESHRGTDAQRFQRNDPDMEIEFLVHEKGAGAVGNHYVASMGISVEGLRDLEVLKSAPLSLSYMGRHLLVPEPEAYVLHKLIINHNRAADKREKDIESILLLVTNLQNSKRLGNGLFLQIWNGLSKGQKTRARDTMIEHSFYSLLKIVEPEGFF